jgi:hypothetical protein
LRVRQEFEHLHHVMQREKSRPPKISRVGTGRERSSSVHPGNSCTSSSVLAAPSSKCAGPGATAPRASRIAWKSAGVGIRSSSSGALSRPGGRWASAEATISLPTRVGAPSVTAYATRPPGLKRTDRPRRSPDGRAARRCHRPAPHWPPVLLHGDLLTIDLNFGPLLEPLAASRQVIAVELQGHGHTGVRTDSISSSPGRTSGAQNGGSRFCLHRVPSQTAPRQNPRRRPHR